MPSIIFLPCANALRATGNKGEDLGPIHSLVSCQESSTTFFLHAVTTEVSFGMMGETDDESWLGWAQTSFQDLRIQILS